MRSIFRGFAFFLTVFSAFQIQAQSAEQTLFSNQKPKLTGDSDGPKAHYELGMKFSSIKDGQIKAIRFYKSKKESGVHTGRIFSSSGEILAQISFTSESASGWQQQALKVPLSITANKEYTVSVNTGNTYYVDTLNFFSKKLSKGNLQSAAKRSGVFGNVGSIPTSSFKNSNYFRDVVFVTGAVTPPPVVIPPPTSDTTKPGAAISSPASGASVSGNISVSALASDNVGVKGVQFIVDGVNFGSEDSSAPFSVNLDTTDLANGSHSLTAKARDAAGNSQISAVVAIMVNNVVAQPPVSGDLPSAANTGWQHTGVKLKASGSIEVTTNGTVIDGMDISGDLYISASNVTIKRCRVRSNNYFPIRIYSGSNIIIEDVEVDGMGGSNKGILIDNGAVTLTRVNIHDSEDGMHISGNGPVILQDSFVHSPRHAASAHSDGLEIESVTNVMIRNNNLDYSGANTSSVMIDNYFGGLNGVTVEGNLMGGGAYILYVDASFNSSSLSNVKILNNRFLRGSSAYGNAVIRGSLPNFVMTGNVYDDNGQPIN